MVVSINQLPERLGMNRTDLNRTCESPAGVTLWGSAVRYGKLSQNHRPHSRERPKWGFLRFLILRRAWIPKCRDRAF